MRWRCRWASRCWSSTVRGSGDVAMETAGIVLLHPQYELVAVAAIIGVVPEVVVEAGVLTVVRFQQSDRLVH